MEFWKLKARKSTGHVTSETISSFSDGANAIPQTNFQVLHSVHAALVPDKLRVGVHARCRQPVAKVKLADQKQTEASSAK